MHVRTMIERIREIIAKSDGTEKETYEALMEEADGWKMRLEELEDEGDE